MLSSVEIRPQAHNFIELLRLPKCLKRPIKAILAFNCQRLAVNNEALQGQWGEPLRRAALLAVDEAFVRQRLQAFRILETLENLHGLDEVASHVAQQTAYVVEEARGSVARGRLAPEAFAFPSLQIFFRLREAQTMFKFGVTHPDLRDAERRLVCKLFLRDARDHLRAVLPGLPGPFCAQRHSASLSSVVGFAGEPSVRRELSATPQETFQDPLPPSKTQLKRWRLKANRARRAAEQSCPTKAPTPMADYADDSDGEDDGPPPLELEEPLVNNAEEDCLSLTAPPPSLDLRLAADSIAGSNSPSVGEASSEEHCLAKPASSRLLNQEVSPASHGLPSGLTPVETYQDAHLAAAPIDRSDAPPSEADWATQPAEHLSGPWSLSSGPSSAYSRLSRDLAQLAGRLRRARLGAELHCQRLSPWKSGL